MNFLLKLKSWQLFLIFICPILLSEIFQFDPFALESSIFSAISLMVILLWFYKVGVFSLRLSHKKTMLFVFRVLFVCNLLLASVLINLSIYQHFSIDDYYHLISLLTAIGLVFHFYMMYLVAKSLCMNKSTLPSLFKVFYMLWFFPIGIWWLQPKINELITNQPT